MSEPAAPSIDERADAGWWEARRGRYLALLAASFAGAFFAYCGAVEFCARAHADVDVEITLFTLFGQVLAFLLVLAVANACYGLGAAAERWAKPRDADAFRRWLFAAGLAFSAALPWVVPASLVVECIRAPKSGEYEMMTQRAEHGPLTTRTG